MSRSWLVKKGKILWKKETACAKTQKCDLGGGSGGKSLQTNLAFLEPGCLKPERAVEARERRRDQAMTKFQIGMLRGLDFILRTQGAIEGFSAWKRHNRIGISVFRHWGGGWVRAQPGALLYQEKHFKNPKKKMSRRGLDGDNSIGRRAQDY